MAEEARHLRQDTDCAVVLNMPGGIVHQAQFLRGFEDWFADLIANPEFCQALMEKLADLWIEMATDEFIAGAAWILFWGRRGLPDGHDVHELYRKMVSPPRRSSPHRRGQDPHHTCGPGAPHPRPDRAGRDAHPVQVSAGDGQ
jgi:hypothetical protein